MNFKRFLVATVSIIAISILIGIFQPSSKIVDAFSVNNVAEKEKITLNHERVENTPIASNYAKLNNYVSYSNSRTGYGGMAANSISIAGRTIPVVDVANTTVNAGNHVNKYGNNFYYGHNTSAVFGGIVNLGVGDVFSISYNGVTHNYRVSKTMIFEKNVEKGLLQLNGSGSYMKNVSLARSNGVQYSVSLMTCYGVSYGNGDASHRFVIFANEY